jgi:hypothetical protein
MNCKKSTENSRKVESQSHRASEPLRSEVGSQSYRRQRSEIRTSARKRLGGRQDGIIGELEKMLPNCVFIMLSNAVVFRDQGV